MSGRKGLSKKLRFEVFKRDSFVCQYCGGKAPNVVLHVDHIHPLAEGGTDDLVNLITSCLACNLGKGARTLSDKVAIEKQHAQLAELQERREQLEMMVKWQRSLVDLERDTVEKMVDFWRELQPGARAFGLNEYGRGELKKWLNKYSVEEVMTAMRKAALEKMSVGPDGETFDGSVTEAFHFVPRLLRTAAEAKKEPYVRDAYYIRGILRRRFEDAVVDWQAKRLLLDVMNAGSDPEIEKDWAKKATSWWNWKTETEKCIHELLSEDEPE